MIMKWRRGSALTSFFSFFDILLNDGINYETYSCCKPLLTQILSRTTVTSSTRRAHRMLVLKPLRLCPSAPSSTASTESSRVTSEPAAWSSTMDWTRTLNANESLTTLRTGRTQTFESHWQQETNHLARSHHLAIRRILLKENYSLSTYFPQMKIDCYTVGLFI